jgi:hypothetical protein
MAGVGVRPSPTDGRHCDSVGGRKSRQIGRSLIHKSCTGRRYSCADVAVERARLFFPSVSTRRGEMIGTVRYGLSRESTATNIYCRVRFQAWLRVILSEMRPAFSAKKKIEHPDR